MALLEAREGTIKMGDFKTSAPCKIVSKGTARRKSNHISKNLYPVMYVVYAATQKKFFGGYWLFWRRGQASLVNPVLNAIEVYGSIYF